MKRKIAIIVCIALVITLTACTEAQKEPVSEPEITQEQSAPTVETQPSSAAPTAVEQEQEKDDDLNRVPAEWKQLYINYMQNKFTPDSGYNTIVLADVTGDGVPALLYTWGLPGMGTGIVFEASIISNGRVVNLTESRTISAFVKSKTTGEYYAIFTAVRAMYADAVVWSPNPDGALPWKATYQLRTEHYEDSNPAESFYIQDGVKYTFKSADEIQTYLAEGLDRTPAGAIYESTELYELVHFPSAALTSAQDWTQAEKLISTFFDEYDGFEDNVTAGGGAEPKQVRIDADGGLRMRKGPDASYNVIVVVPQNALVELADGEKDTADWIYVSYGGERGWVSKEFVSHDLEPPKVEAGDWAKVYYDYLSEFKRKDNLDYYGGPTWTHVYDGIEFAVGEIEFYKITQNEYTMILTETATASAEYIVENENKNPYVIRNGKVVGIYDKKERAKYLYPIGEWDTGMRPKGTYLNWFQIYIFTQELEDVGGGKLAWGKQIPIEKQNATLQPALDWLKSQQ